MRKIFAAGFLIGIAAAVFAWPQSGDELDSLRVCAATQKLIFENTFVRVIDDRIPPGVTEPKHKHRHGVTVWLNGYDLEQVIFPQGNVVHAKRDGGSAGWSEAIIHTVKNTGTTESHTIRIELK